MKALLTEDFGQRKRPTLRLPVPGTASEDDDRTAGQNAEPAPNGNGNTSSTSSIGVIIAVTVSVLIVALGGVAYFVANRQGGSGQRGSGRAVANPTYASAADTPHHNMPARVQNPLYQSAGGGLSTSA